MLLRYFSPVATKQKRPHHIGEIAFAYGYKTLRYRSYRANQATSLGRLNSGTLLILESATWAADITFFASRYDRRAQNGYNNDNVRLTSKNTPE